MNKLAFIKNRLIVFISLLFISILTFSQEGGGGGTDIDVNIEKKGDWYTQPWVWIVGGAVFILLLVALLRSGKRAD